jgi:peptide-methionine (S)-S-oxide reductase
MKRIICLLPMLAALNFSAPAQTNSMNTNKTEIADLGGGCFWCMEAVFERLPGVISVTSGFAGGTTENPTYQEVCTETTGHAEVTEIVFDPAKISYDKLLEVFWQAHDPTTLNRQGADEGTSYRSIILYRDEKQKLEAEKSKLAAQSNFRNPIVTEIVPLKKVLQGRGLSPGILRQQFQRALLPGRHRSETGETGKEESDSGNSPDEWQIKIGERTIGLRLKPAVHARVCRSDKTPEAAD